MRRHAGTAIGPALRSQAQLPRGKAQKANVRPRIPLPSCPLRRFQHVDPAAARPAVAADAPGLSGPVSSGRAGRTRQPFVADPYTSPRGMSAIPGNDVPIMCVTSPKWEARESTTVTLNHGVAWRLPGKRVVMADADHNGILLAPHREGEIERRRLRRDGSEVRASPTPSIQTRIPSYGYCPPERRVKLSSGGDRNAMDWQQAGHGSQSHRSAADMVLVDVAAGRCTAAPPTIMRGLHPRARRRSGGAFGRPPWPGRDISSGSRCLPRLRPVTRRRRSEHAGLSRARRSLDVLKELCTGPGGSFRVFDVPIARSAALHGSRWRAASPLWSRGERTDTPTIGWVFEMLASGTFRATRC